MASPSTVLSMGLGTWSTSNLLVTLGFGSGTVVVTVNPRITNWFNFVTVAPLYANFVTVQRTNFDVGTPGWQ